MPDYFVRKAQCKHHQPFAGIDLYTAAGDKMMLSLVDLDAGAEVPAHSHPHEQMGILLEGALQFTAGGQTTTILPGDMWRIPGGVEHMVVAIDGPARALDIFSPVREDLL